MAILPAGAHIRGYPTRRVRIWAAVLTRGHGYGHKTSPAGTPRAQNLTRGCCPLPAYNQNRPNINIWPNKIPRKPLSPTSIPHEPRTHRPIPQPIAYGEKKHPRSASPTRESLRPPSVPAPSSPPAGGGTRGYGLLLPGKGKLR
jgi:hypothetical protein